METVGIMEQVRGLLSQGLKSSDIIAQGYAASTVYGVQRRLRKQKGILGHLFPTGPDTPGCHARMASENTWLRRSVEAAAGGTRKCGGPTTFPTAAGPRYS